MSTNKSTSKKEKPVIKCESVYKIFGENAEKMLNEANGKVDAQVFQEAGCVVGVNNAHLKFIKEKCLSLWGYQDLVNQPFFAVYLD